MKIKLKTLEQLQKSGWVKRTRSKSNAIVRKGYIENSYRSQNRKKYLVYHGYSIPQWLLPLLGNFVKVKTHSRNTSGKLYFVLDIPNIESHPMPAWYNNVVFSQDAVDPDSLKGYESNFHLIKTRIYTNTKKTEVSLISNKTVKIGTLKMSVDDFKSTCEWLEGQGVL